MTDKITLFYSPQTRAATMLVLAEELGAPYDLHEVNMKAGEQRSEAYLKINPLGKVPAVRHNDAIVTEQVAIYIYLADLYPDAGLAPAIGDPLRASYLRWLVYYAACYEPALMDKAMKREPSPRVSCPYGDFDEMLATILGPVAAGPYLLGERFSAADLLWGQGLRLGAMFKILPKNPVIESYVERVTSRPSFKKVSELDEKMAVRHAAAAAGTAAN
jgi:glutathione S-transferase